MQEHLSAISLVESLTDQQLRLAIIELNDFKKTGILNEGILRRLIERLAENQGVVFSIASFSLQFSLLSAASNKWLELTQSEESEYCINP